MAEIGHELSITALKMKVTEIIMIKSTPFQNGILGGSWM
jgi:hypothetical protein